MNHYLKYITFIIVCLLVNCNYNDGSKQAISEQNAVCLKSDKIARFIHIKDIKLDESKYKYSSIYSVMPDKSGFYIHERKASKFIKVDLDGKFKYFIGHKGNGPGEYNRITNAYPFAIDSAQNFYLYNNDRLVLIQYDSLNNFVKEINLNKFGFLWFQLSLGTKQSIMSLSEINLKDYDGNLNCFHFIDSEFNVLKTISFSFPAIYNKYNLNPYRLFFNWVNDDDYIYILFTPLPYIYKYNFDGQLVSVIGKKMDDYALIDKDFKNLSADEIQYEMLTHSESQRIMKFKEDYLFFAYYTTKNLKRDYTYSDLKPSNIDVNAVLYTRLGESIDIDWSGIGEKTDFTYIDSAGYAYCLKGEPDNQEIKVYEIIIDTK